MVRHGSAHYRHLLPAVMPSHHATTSECVVLCIGRSGAAKWISLVQEVSTKRHAGFAGVEHAV